MVGEGQAGPSADLAEEEFSALERVTAKFVPANKILARLVVEVRRRRAEAVDADHEWAQWSEKWRATLDTFSSLRIKDAAALRASEAALAEALKRNTELPIKYGRDHSGKTTLQELIDKFLAAQPAGKDAFCDVVDEEFIFGCYGHLFKDAERHYMAKDIRGMLWALCSGLRAARTEVTKAERERCAKIADGAASDMPIDESELAGLDSVEYGYRLAASNILAAIRAPQPPEPGRCDHTLTPNDITYECKKPARHTGDHESGNFTWWHPPDPPSSPAPPSATLTPEMQRRAERVQKFTTPLPDEPAGGADPDYGLLPPPPSEEPKKIRLHFDHCAVPDARFVDDARCTCGVRESLDALDVPSPEPKREEPPDPALLDALKASLEQRKR